MPDELARTFDVRIEPGDRGFVGSIEFLDDGGERVSRRVAGEQCEPVVDSLALIAALALDATLRSDEPLPTASAAPSSSLPVSPPAPLQVVPARQQQGVVPAARRREPRLQSVRVGLTGGYDTLLEAFPVGTLGQLDFRTGFSVRLTAHLAATTVTPDPGRSADLRLLGLASSGCYAPLRADRLLLSACAFLDLGTLRAAGQKSDELPRPGAKTVFWGSLGPELRIAWEGLAPVWLELSGSLGFPLVAGRRFEFHLPDVRVFEVPRVTSSAGLAAGVRF